MKIESVTVIETAAPCTARVIISKGELQPILDKYYTKKIENLPHNIKKEATRGGRRQLERDRVIKLMGGQTHFYSEILSDIIITHVKDGTNRSTMAVANIELSEDQNNYVLDLVCYMEPTVEFTKQHGSTFKVSVPSVKPEDIEKKVSERFTTLQEQHAVLVPDGESKRKELPPVDNELALSSNYESLIQMRTQFEKDAEDQITTEREHALTNLITNELVNNANISPIPDLWCKNTAESIMRSQNIPVDQGLLSDQLRFLVNMLKDQMRGTLALRKYGILNNIPGDQSFDGSNRYIQIVVKHILNTMEVVDSTTDKYEIL